VNCSSKYDREDKKCIHKSEGDYNTSMDLREIICDQLWWMELAQDRVQRRVSVIAEFEPSDSAAILSVCYYT